MTFAQVAPNILMRSDDKAAIVAPQGELDVASSPRLRAVLHSLAEEGKDVVVDLSGITFVDSTTIGVFIGAKRRLASAGRSLRLTSPCSSVRRVFELIGLIDAFSID